VRRWAGAAYHLRARRVPAAALVAVLAALLARGTAVLAGSGSPLLPSALMAAAGLAAAAIGTTLGGADEELERSTPIRWWRVRLVHLGLAAALVGSVLSVAGSPVVVARDLAGAIGLAGLGCALLGAARSWVAVVPWLVIPPLVSRLGSAWYAGVVAWTVQPGHSTAAAGTAAALAALGAAVYVGYGARVRSRETF